MNNKISKGLDNLSERALRMLNEPWLIKHEPFKVIENIYFVGTNWVSVFLIDTKEGLILIDCAMQETLYLLIDSIHRLGFDPRDIKKLLLTHGHFDHCGAARAIQEMSGCEVWIGKDDAFFFTERRDLIAFEERVPEFRIDHFYDYSSAINLGDIIIEPVHCPGHTFGTTSLFFDIVHEGQNLTCGIHGGLGSAVMSKKNLVANRLPLSLQETYCQSIDKVIDKKVDIVLPSHAGHCVDYDFLSLSKKGVNGEQFINTEAWEKMLSHKKKEMLKLLNEEV